jgi:hypothetical protein
VFSVVEETLFVSLKKEIVSLVSSPEKRREEATLLKRIKFLSSRTQEEWEIPSNFVSPQQWSSAVFELAGIERNPTPTRRLNALVRAAKAIYAEFKEYVLPLREEGKSDSVLSADDLVPIFIFVLCQSQLRHPLLNRDLLWSDISHPDLRHGECGYYLTTYELALQAILDLELENEDIVEGVDNGDDGGDDDYSALRGSDNILERSRNIGILRVLSTSTTAI